MNRTLISLAIIKTHWEKNKTDYIDNFIPLVASLLSKNKYTEIDLALFQIDFKKRYGLDIPKNALITIFNRAKGKKIVKRDQGKFFFNSDYSGKEIKSIESSDIERKFNKVVNSIIEFASKEHELDVNEKDIEEALLSFLKQHDLDILFAAKDHSVLPKVKSTKKLKYLISSFTLYAAKQEPDLFQFLSDISVGHALSGAILYSELNSFSGKLKNLNIYFDTPLILGLLGFNGEFKKSSIEELIKILNEEKANLFILETTRGELDKILSDCHGWLEKRIYDLEKATRVLRHCHREEISASDLEQKILAIDNIFQSFNIISTSVPSHIENTEFQIDEVDLKKTIKNIYSSAFKNYDKNDYSREGTINRDVKVLSGMYRFRQGFKPRTLKDSKDIFITSNTALAFASRVFETKENGTHFTIPTCLTDVFLGTVIWMQSPQKIENLNTKKFIADCYSATQPSSDLIKKYIQEVEKLKGENKLNKDEYYILRTHRASLNLLEKKTMGDPEAFDGSSTTEILDSLMLSIKGKEQEKYEKEKEEHRETLEKLSRAIASTDKIKSNQNQKAENIAKIASKIIFWFLTLLIAFFISVNLFPSYFNPSSNSKTIIWFSIGIITLLNLSTGFNILGLQDKLRGKIKRKVLIWLEK
jgi:hypothetical protein